MLGHGLVGFSALGMATLGFLWYSPTGATPPGKQEGEWRLLEPVSYENLTVFPVVSSSGYDTSAFLTLEDGLSNGEVTVREQGADAIYRNHDASPPVAQNYGGPSVNQLVLGNHSKRPLLLLAGGLVSGGKQDRVIAKDRIGAPFNEPLALNAFFGGPRRSASRSQIYQAQTHVQPSV